MLTSQAGAMGRDSDLSGADRYYLPCVAPKRLGLYLEHTANKYHLLLFSLIFVSILLRLFTFCGEKHYIKFAYYNPGDATRLSKRQGDEYTISPNKPALPEDMIW